jgi:hypothetical protein
MLIRVREARYIDRQYHLSLYTTQATRHTDVFATMLPFFRTALVLARGESSWTAVLVRRWPILGWWRWRPIGILAFPLALQALALPLKAATFLF